MSLQSNLTAAFIRVAQEINKRGLPKGGTAGQVLTKASATDYAGSWTSVAGATGIGASAYKTGTTGLTGSVPGQVSFTGAELNDSPYDSTNSPNGYYVVDANGIRLKKAGLYLVTWHADVQSSSGGNRSAWVQRNGTTFGEFTVYAASGESRLSSSRVIRVAADTQLTMFVSVDGSSAQVMGSAPKDTSMTCAFLGA